MISTTVIKNIGSSVYPHSRVCHLSGGRHFERVVFFALIRNNSEASVLVFGLLEFGDAERSKSGAVGDTRELGA